MTTSINMNTSESYNIFNFLKDHKVGKQEKHTHTCFGSPWGSYNIPDDKLDIFYELYDKALQNGSKLHITEKHSEYSPMLIDLDEKYSKSITTRQHTETNIKDIVKLYNDEIINCFNIDVNDKRLIAFVFEKPNINIPNSNDKKSKYVKDGIHIIYPFIISDQYPQLYIRRKILKKIVPFIENLPLENNVTDLVDKAVIQRNNWFLYGSTKPDAETYQISHIFDGKLNTVDMNTFTFEFISKFFSIRGHSSSDCIPLRDEVKKDVFKLMKKKTVKRSSKKIKKESVNNEELENIIDILSKERADEYNSWLDVGFALHNINPNNETNQYYLDLWIKFSKKSSKYKDGVCEKFWDNMKNDGLSLGSIYFYAKQDNIDEFKSIIRSNLQNLIDSSVENNLDSDLGKVLAEMYKYQFVCRSSKKTGLWYEFVEHRWVRMETNIELFNKISEDMCEEYCRRLSLYNIDASNPDLTEEERETAQKKAEKTLLVIKKLRTNNCKKNIIDECKGLLYDKNFQNNLDENRHLIGFENGVYDLKRGEFRDGKPDDYISMTTGIDYIPFDEDDDNWLDLKYFIDTIFPDEEIRDYFLTFLATCLEGVNREEKFRIWIGSGSNGKSKIEELFNESFGEYCMKFPITLLTGKRAQSNACSPEVIRSKGKRFCYFEEPNENEQVNAGRLKEYTGGDKIEGRGLYQDNIEFKPQFKLAVLTNNMLVVPPHDEGVWRRLETIEFKSKFKSNPDPQNKYEFEIDRSISEKIHIWKELFMSLLLNVYFKKYRESGYNMVVPEEITKYTKEYQSECDKHSQFIKDTVDHTKVMSDTISLVDLHNEYKYWHDDNHNNSSYISRLELKEYLIKKFGKKCIKYTTLYGFKLKMKESISDFSSTSLNDYSNQF